MWTLVTFLLRNATQGAKLGVWLKFRIISFPFEIGVWPLLVCCFPRRGEQRGTDDTRAIGHCGHFDILLRGHQSVRVWGGVGEVGVWTPPVDDSSWSNRWRSFSAIPMYTHNVNAVVLTKQIHSAVRSSGPIITASLHVATVLSHSAPSLLDAAALPFPSATPSASQPSPLASSPP